MRGEEKSGFKTEEHIKLVQASIAGNDVAGVDTQMGRGDEEGAKSEEDPDGLHGKERVFWFREDEQQGPHDRKKCALYYYQVQINYRDVIQKEIGYGLRGAARGVCPRVILKNQSQAEDKKRHIKRTAVFFGEKSTVSGRNSFDDAHV